MGSPVDRTDSPRSASIPIRRASRPARCGQPEAILWNAAMLNRDIVPPSKRSEMMRRVGQQRTPVEQAASAILWGLGHHYRLNNRRLPGSPDLSNQSEGWALFVNGCFWHGHKNCPKTKGGPSPRVPALHRRFWTKKIKDNRKRDARKCRELRRLGLRVVIVWECQLKRTDKVIERLRRVLGGNDRR